jgi:hypothetical protein
MKKLWLNLGRLWATPLKDHKADAEAPHLGRLLFEQREVEGAPDVLAIHWHEQGLVQQTRSGSRTVHYSEIESFKQFALRRNGHGGHAFSNYMFCRLRDGEVITFTRKMTQETDADLELLRDAIARMVAERLHQQLVKEGTEIPWGLQVVLGQHTFTCGAGPGNDQGPPRTQPYSKHFETFFRNERLLLFTRGEYEALLSISCMAENFYPGLLLFQRLCDEAAKRDGGQDPAASLPELPVASVRGWFRTGERCSTAGEYSFRGHVDGTSWPPDHWTELSLRVGKTFPPLTPTNKEAYWELVYTWPKTGDTCDSTNTYQFNGYTDDGLTWPPSPHRPEERIHLNAGETFPPVNNRGAYWEKVCIRR